MQSKPLTEKKIIPCMDIRHGRVVKGVQFSHIADVADPVELAMYYNSQGADMLVFYDIAASVDQRSVFTDLLRRVRDSVQIPLMVGGGIATLEDVDRAVAFGADRISINSGAIRDPQLVGRAAKKYGSEAVVLSMDVRRVEGQYRLFEAGGSRDTGIDALEWAAKGAGDGAGEIVLNSIDTDGVGQGYDLEMLQAVYGVAGIPLVASGGAGEMEHFAQALVLPGVDTALAASVFHSRQILIGELKQYLAGQGIGVKA